MQLWVQPDPPPAAGGCSTASGPQQRRPGEPNLRPRRSSATRTSKSSKVVFVKQRSPPPSTLTEVTHGLRADSLAEECSSTNNTATLVRVKTQAHAESEYTFPPTFYIIKTRRMLALRPDNDEKSNVISGTTFLHMEKRVSFYGAAAPYMVNARCGDTHVQASSLSRARTPLPTFNSRSRPRF